MKMLVMVCALAFCMGAQAKPRKAAHKKAAERVYFVEPKDGAVVTSPFLVKFGLEGMKIGKVGDLTKGLGHHHLLVDAGPVKKGTVVPSDATHLHFGKGQTETELSLPPGDHALTLQFADGAHRSYGPQMAKTIHIHVKGK
jgi:hypothetical protein